VNYTNFNTCWDRRAQLQPLGLVSRAGRRFGFRPAPAPECEVDGPAEGLRQAEVRRLVEAGVIRLPAEAVSAPAPGAVVPAKDRVVRHGKPIAKALMRLVRSGREFSVADLPAGDRKAAMGRLTWWERQGLVELLRPGKRGTTGSYSIYRGTPEGKR
jgi:hypothetical protein